MFRRCAAVFDHIRHMKAAKLKVNLVGFTNQRRRIGDKDEQRSDNTRARLGVGAE